MKILFVIETLIIVFVIIIYLLVGFSRGLTYFNEKKNVVPLLTSDSIHIFPS